MHILQHVTTTLASYDYKAKRVIGAALSLRWRFFSRSCEMLGYVCTAAATISACS